MVRVFNLPTADKLYTLRRGNAHCEIYSLAFNHTATMLALSSSTGTIHVFQLGKVGGDRNQGTKVALLKTCGEMAIGWAAVLIAVRDGSSMC